MSDAATVLRVSQDLAAIGDLAGDLHTQALHRASHPLMPGGHATVDLAPVANLEAALNVLAHRETRGLDTDHAYDEGDDWPPLQLLLFWSEAWRRDHNRELDTTPTLDTEARFLAGLVQWAYDHEPRYEDFAKDVSTARRRLEDELQAGIRAERSQVPCLDCDRQPRLIRVYGTRAADDAYKCPLCKRRYDQAGYLRAQAQWLRSEGAERFVPLALARLSINRSPRTIEDWLAKGRVTAYCDLQTRRIHVWWPDIRRLDTTTATRRRTA